MDYFTLEEINLMSPQNCLARLVSCQCGAVCSQKAALATSHVPMLVISTSAS